MAYDSARGRVLLFGGANERQVLADLWSWDGERWSCLSEDGPSPRTFPSLAYDAGGQRLILYGGNRVLFGTEQDGDTFLDDMWAWDGRSWERIQTDTPPARAEAAMVYDSIRRRLVLFGGHRVVDGERIRLGDTWEWNGHRWEQVSSDGPSARNGAAMAYDARRERAILFGGSGASDETWEWDGSAWKRISSADPEGRFNPAMAYDAGRQEIIRFGGWTGQERARGTWRYDGSQWTLAGREGPSSRNHTAMTYDSRRGRIVLFGGHDGDRIFGDTWEWDGTRWSLKSEHSPRSRVDNGH